MNIHYFKNKYGCKITTFKVVFGIWDFYINVCVAENCPDNSVYSWGFSNPDGTPMVVPSHYEEFFKKVLEKENGFIF